MSPSAHRDEDVLIEEGPANPFSIPGGSAQRQAGHPARKGEAAHSDLQLQA